MNFDEDDQSHRKFPKFPKFTDEKIKFSTEKDDEIEKGKEKCSNVKFIPIPVPVNRTEKFEDQNDYYYYNDDDEEEEDDYLDDDDDENKKYIKGNLDKWDKSSRIWLSSGTMFFLIILFHLIQVRNDLRNFTTTANKQLESACNDLEGKTAGFEKAINMAAQDVGPISFKFVRDLKTKVKSAFHFAGQIFGGKVRETFIMIFEQYYCLLVGGLAVYQSLLRELTEVLKELLPGENFIIQMYDLMNVVVANIVEFISNPEEFFSKLFGYILDYIFDKTLVRVLIPSLTGKNLNEICEQVELIDFSEIDRLIKGYMAKIIAVITIILILYNYFNFVFTLETEKDDTIRKGKGENNKKDNENEDENIDNENWIPMSSLWNCFKWLKNFLKYPPFWMFLFMGTFGILHIKFSKSFRIKAEELIKNYVEPTIEQIRNDFVTMLKNYVMDLEMMWRESFSKLLEPFTNFIKGLSQTFRESFDFVVTKGKFILELIDGLINNIFFITVQKSLMIGIYAVLDCFILRNIKKWIQIVEIIYSRLFGDKWSGLNGGIIDILQKSIGEMFGKLNISAHLKGFFSMHFAMFLNLVAKRSIFLYVYLILCAILLCQGVIMMTIKFLLGYM